MDLELLGSHPNGSHDLPVLELKVSHFQGVSLLQPQTHPTLPQSYQMLGRGANLLRLDDRSTISTTRRG